MIIHSIKKYASKVAVACDEVLKSKFKKQTQMMSHLIEQCLKKYLLFQLIIRSWKKKKIICYPLDCGWNDIGSWDGLSKWLKKLG